MMRIKHSDIEISRENPFANCKLGREPYAKILTEIIDTYSDGFVLAINNEWGTGKTTFVKMWKEQLLKDGYQAIYFNAWENDFSDNPLVAIMAELEPLTKSNIADKKIFKSVVKKGAVLTKNVVPALLKSLLSKHIIDSDVLTEVISNTSKAATEILEEEIKEYTDKKKTIIDFRNEMEKFIGSSKLKKPLVFIVDELDRCRPTYSVEVLEQLKHLFSVKGIVFVLSIDKSHLASSIKGYYGTEMINTDEYLRRFIDLEYIIRKPSNKSFCRYLFEYYSFADFFYSDYRKNFSEVQDDAHLLMVAELLFDKANATLRQQEKIFALTRLVLNSFKFNEYTFSHLLFFLVYLRVMHNNIYEKIDHNLFTLQELSDIFVEIMPVDVKNEYGLNFFYVNALLLYFYNMDLDIRNRVELVTKDEKGVSRTPIRIGDNNDSSLELARCLERVYQQWDYQRVKLQYLTCRIGLTESISVK